VDFFVFAKWPKAGKVKIFWSEVTEITNHFCVPWRGYLICILHVIQD
jgi:hypothetical protein